MSFTLTPVYGNDFVNRKELLNEMVSTLADFNSRSGFALYGRRRVGKTSVLRELGERFKKHPKIILVYFSIWELVEGTVEEFVQSFSSAILEAYRGKKLPLKHKVKNLFNLPLDILKGIFHQLNISLKLQGQIEVLLTFREKGKIPLANLIEKVFDLAENLAQETGTRCVLLIDEFPSIMDLKNGKKIGPGIIGKIRTIMETQKNTLLCISGSIRRTMRSTVLSTASPFYRQFIVKEILPLEKEHVISLLQKNLAATLTKEAAESIYQFSRGVPFYIQFIGRELERTGKNKITKEDIADSIEEFLKQEGNLLFSEEFEELGPKERRLVLTMASLKLSSPAEIAKAMQESLSTVSTYLRYLENKQIIKKETRGVYLFEDPIFLEWLQRKA